ncbi:adhesion G protein-coupled receptor E2-like isoform X2 [Dendronephthya gigantea]|uniref:adhesion G protein-coupled receptor E2-like isoform X2 n=1 Tax=Dendronephthya gigantea TaxID=151771 RepID=UPI00106A2D09|nr:adhesion G protein-coupled receptor E2-like isoform X2 [Dendronephthya gigantea]
MTALRRLLLIFAIAMLFYSAYNTHAQDVDECALKTNNSCHSQATCRNDTGSYTCICNYGFSGNGTICEDVDECALGTHQCPSQNSCNNTIGSYVCTCGEGFTGNTTICEDKDECALGNHACHSQATCNNTIGSYTCSCNEGFTGNGTICADEDECVLETHICDLNARCNNAIGSYTCTCNKGFTGNGTFCKDQDECMLKNHSCHFYATCNNTIGSYACTCKNGFLGNGTICKDEDECASGNHSCHSKSTCNNTIGSYTCSCNEGFTWDGKDCKALDEDECALGHHRCHSQASCNNTIGSYTCSCNKGFTGNGTFCRVLKDDKCLLGTHGCHLYASCSNINDSYTCTCNAGFSGNGTDCKDVDECEQKTYRCHSNATCKNNIGSYACDCNEGFMGNGTICEDIDECTSYLHMMYSCPLETTCRNTIGSFDCACNKGFTGIGICRDEDECASGNHSCHSQATCNNTIGSYTCSCNKGFTGDGKDCKESRQVCFSARNKSNDEMDRLIKKLNELHRENKSEEERKKGAQEIINDLACLTNLDSVGVEPNGTNQQNLPQAVEILQRLVSLNISDKNFDLLRPANNILDPRNAISWSSMKDGKLIRELVMTLQTYGIQLGNILKSDASSSSTSRTQSNVQLRVKYMNQSRLAQGEGLFTFPNASFNISRDALPKDSRAVVAVVWYKTLSSFLVDKVHAEGDTEGSIKSTIISATVRPQPLKTPFKEPVRISWETSESGKGEFRSCAYWKPEISESKWKTDGCQGVTAKPSSTRFTCECFHLTAFAYTDILKEKISEEERRSVHAMSIVGCSISLVCVLLAILAHYFWWRRLDETAIVPTKLFMNLCAAIAMANFFCILAESALSYETFCTVSSTFLYLFVLVLFGLMLCEGIMIYLRLTNVYFVSGWGGKYLKAFYAFCWGIPVIIVVLLAAAISGEGDFITEYACWCRKGSPPFWTFIVTLCAIILINLVIFLLVLRHASFSRGSSITRPRDDSKNKSATFSVKGAAVHLILLFLTWMFALLAFHENKDVFRYLFAIFNILQAALMLVVCHLTLNRKMPREEGLHEEEGTEKTPMATSPL